MKKVYENTEMKTIEISFSLFIITFHLEYRQR